MRRLLLILVVLAVVLSAFAWAAQAAPPPEGPPGLAKALAAQIEHNPRLLSTPGVVGTAVGLGADGAAVVKVFTARRGVDGVPAFIDGVPVVVRVTGDLTALGARPTPKRNRPPVVTITSPAAGASFIEGTPVLFSGTAIDKQEGDLTENLLWSSSVDGPLGVGSGFYAMLSAGTHTITATCTDMWGAEGTASVVVTVSGASDLTTTDVWPRPVPIGVSTGNGQSVSAGTIACRVVDATGHVYALSNTHVYAPDDIDGQTELGDPVVQPGLYDAPGNAYDPTLQIGTVTAYKPIDGSILAFNEIDAAVAQTTVARLDSSTPVALGGYGVPGSTTTPAVLDMAVQKFGRSTLLTVGTVTDINATMVVGYDDDWYAWFTGQIVVTTTGVFEQAGDSGSLVVTNDADASPVGLLFAGNADGTMAIVNPIEPVLDYFGVSVDGK